MSFRDSVGFTLGLFKQKATLKASLLSYTENKVFILSGNLERLCYCIRVGITVLL